MKNKITVEEHFATQETIGDVESFKLSGWQELRTRMLDLDAMRIEDMDKYGIEFMVQSLNAPAIQGILDTQTAIDVSKRANEALAEAVQRHPTRYAGLAALPMQDPDAAAEELTRCVNELGFVGALVNGYTQKDVADSAVHYDLPEYRPFWAQVEQLGRPFYLHPRVPIAARQQSYEGHPWLLSAAWGFPDTTGIHTMRLMGSGLFDEYPKLKLVIGHMGERIPFDLWRIDHRRVKGATSIAAKQTMRHYMTHNVWITTSGQFSDATLQCAHSELGADRILFSIDYPFEDTADGAPWFDETPLSEEDRLKIGRQNAIDLFGLNLT